MTDKKDPFAGIPVVVVSDAEAEMVDFVVCMPLGPSEFDDNFTGECAFCGIRIMYRWHAPRRPRKICLDCALKLGADKQMKNVTSEEF